MPESASGSRAWPSRLRRSTARICRCSSGETRQQSVRHGIARIGLRPRFQRLHSRSMLPVTSRSYNVSMKNRSASLARWRNWYALSRLCRDSADSPIIAVTDPSFAWAIAKSGSIATARSNSGMARARPDERLTCIAALYAFQRFQRCRRRFLSGVEYFSMVASDSPSRVRNRVAIWLSEPRTSSFRATCACSSARMSPVAQFFARRPEDVLTAQAGDRSIEHRGACRSHAHSLRNLGSQSRIRRLLHHRQRSSDAIIRDEAEERRLLKLCRESLAQRVVEHRIAGPVGELGEDDRVLVGQRRRTAAIDHARDSGGDDDGGRADREPPRAANARAPRAAPPWRLARVSDVRDRCAGRRRADIGVRAPSPGTSRRCAPAPATPRRAAGRACGGPRPL